MNCFLFAILLLVSACVPRRGVEVSRPSIAPTVEDSTHVPPLKERGDPNSRATVSKNKPDIGSVIGAIDDAKSLVERRSYILDNRAATQSKE